MHCQGLSAGPHGHKESYEVVTAAALPNLTKVSDHPASKTRRRPQRRPCGWSPTRRTAVASPTRRSRPPACRITLPLPDAPRRPSPLGRGWRSRVRVFPPACLPYHPLHELVPEEGQVDTPRFSQGERSSPCL